MICKTISFAEKIFATSPPRGIFPGEFPPIIHFWGCTTVSPFKSTNIYIFVISSAIKNITKTIFCLIFFDIILLDKYKNIFGVNVTKSYSKSVTLSVIRTKEMILDRN